MYLKQKFVHIVQLEPIFWLSNKILFLFNFRAARTNFLCTIKSGQKSPITTNTKKHLLSRYSNIRQRVWWGRIDGFPCQQNGKRHQREQIQVQKFTWIILSETWLFTNFFTHTTPESWEIWNIIRWWLGKLHVRCWSKYKQHEKWDPVDRKRHHGNEHIWHRSFIVWC